MADFSDLIAGIQAYVKQNGNNDITGDGLQDILVGMVGAIGEALNDAVSDLESADTTLTNAIGDEEQARQGADNTLGGRITAEEEARQGADTGLQNQVNGINGKIPDAASGTNKLADKAFVQSLVDALTASIAAINDKIPSEASSSNKLADKAFVQALTTALQNALNTLNGKVPAAATSENQLADKAFVTSLTTALQNAINTINTNIGNGFVYAGVATPSGTPVSGKVAYLTAQEGTYTNYGGLFVPAGISVIKYDGTNWSQEQVISMETIYRNPLMGLYDCDTSGSTTAKTVTAVGYVLPTNGGSMKVRMANHTTVDNVTLNINGTGAKDLYYKGKAAGINNTWDDGAVLNVIYDSTNDRYLAYNANAGTGDGVFDVSEYTGDDYAKLEDAIADIPVSEQHGGMEMRFVRSSDNKYVQYRLMHTLANASTAAADFANEANWQGIDSTPTAGSQNLVKSGGVYSPSVKAYYEAKANLAELKSLGYINSTGQWLPASTVHSVNNVPIKPNDVLEITGITSTTGIRNWIIAIKNDGGYYNLSISNTQYVENLGNGVYRITIPDVWVNVDYGCIMWLSSLENVTLRLVSSYVDEELSKSVKYERQNKSTELQDIVKYNLGAKQVDEIIDNDLIVKNLDSIVTGRYIDGSDGTITPLANTEYITMPINDVGYIFVWVLDTSAFNVQKRYAFLDSNKDYINAGTVWNNQAVDLKKDKLYAIPVPNNAAYFALDLAPGKESLVRVYDSPVFIEPDRLSSGIDLSQITNCELVGSDNILVSYINSTGVPVYASTLNSTMLLPCSEGEVLEVSNWQSSIAVTGFSFVAVCFDVDAKFLSAISGSAYQKATYNVTIPTNVKYISFVYETGCDISVKRIKGVGSVKVLTESLILPEEQSNWNGKIWVGLGDSLTAQAYTGLSWSPMVEEATGLVFKNCGVGSTSLAGTANTCFWKRLASVENYNPDIVTILGGANDLYSDIPIGNDSELDAAIANKDCTTFIGAYSYIIESLLTWKKTLRIVLLTTSYAHNNGADHTPGIGLTYKDYANATLRVAEYYGLPVVDLYRNMGLNKLTQDSTLTNGDHIHWNARASQIVASLVIAKFDEINNAVPIS